MVGQLKFEILVLFTKEFRSKMPFLTSLRGERIQLSRGFLGEIFSSSSIMLHNKPRTAIHCALQKMSLLGVKFYIVHDMRRIDSIYHPQRQCSRYDLLPQSHYNHLDCFLKKYRNIFLQCCVLQFSVGYQFEETTRLIIESTFVGIHKMC